MGLGEYFKAMITLDYNGERYRVNRGDIPGLRGYGKIIVRNKHGAQEVDLQGSFRGNIVTEQRAKGTYINGVNIEDLIKRLEKR
jgi:hypothetical protein